MTGHEVEQLEEVEARKDYPERHEDKGLPYSAIKTIRSGQPSGYHWKYILRNFMDGTPAMATGNLTHTMTFEPDKLAERFVKIPDGVGNRSNADKEVRRQLIATKKTLVTTAQVMSAKAMSDAVLAHPDIAALLAGPRIFEGSFKHRDPDTGILFQAKPDALCGSGPYWMVELKTAADASPAGFEKAIGSMHYGIQAALYLDVLRGLGYDVRRFIWPVVETSPPYNMAIYEPTDELLDSSRSAYLHDAWLWQTCVKTGRWPGYPREITSIGMKPWAKREYEHVRKGE